MQPDPTRSEPLGNSKGGETAPLIQDDQVDQAYRRRRGVGPSEGRKEARRGRKGRTSRLTQGTPADGERYGSDGGENVASGPGGTRQASVWQRSQGGKKRPRTGGRRKKTSLP